MNCPSCASAGGREGGGGKAQRASADALLGAVLHPCSSRHICLLCAPSTSPSRAPFHTGWHAPRRLAITLSVLQPRPCPCLAHGWAPVLDDVAWHKTTRPRPAWSRPDPTTPQCRTPPAQPQPRLPTRVGLGQCQQDLLRLVPVLLLTRPGLEGGGLRGGSPEREAGLTSELSRAIANRKGHCRATGCRGVERNLVRCQEGQATGQGQVAAAQRCLSVFSFASFCQAQRVRGWRVPAGRGRS